MIREHKYGILLNDTATDLSMEGYIMMAICMEMIWACGVIGNRISDSLTKIGCKGTLMQMHKRDFNEARELMRKFINKINDAFDGEFDKLFGLPNGPNRYEYIQAAANDIIHLLMIYYSRADGDDEKKARMKKAWLNFKGIDDVDLDAMVDYFKFVS